jgi:hypothetical protein
VVSVQGNKSSKCAHAYEKGFVRSKLQQHKAKLAELRSDIQKVPGL